MRMCLRKPYIPTVKTILTKRLRWQCKEVNQISVNLTPSERPPATPKRFPTISRRLCFEADFVVRLLHKDSWARESRPEMYTCPPPPPPPPLEVSPPLCRGGPLSPPKIVNACVFSSWQEKKFYNHTNGSKNAVLHSNSNYIPNFSSRIDKYLLRHRVKVYYSIRKY